LSLGDDPTPANEAVMLVGCCCLDTSAHTSDRETSSAGAGLWGDGLGGSPMLEDDGGEEGGYDGEEGS
jgi:hypothetical protein